MNIISSEQFKLYINPINAIKNKNNIKTFKRNTITAAISVSQTVWAL